MAAQSQAFADTLRRADLQGYYSTMSSFGVNSVDALLQLTMQDYSAVGVHSMEDRKRLFQLIQTLKSEASNQGSSRFVDSRPGLPSMLPRPPPVSSLPGSQSFSTLSAG
ncbi:hypothetical protein BJ742DRAFT_537298 [Cladochytrium replicatum]|nr:hypothetical protein BJ742DRAFT_537298 [Cladochytrium replicatum]